jgi:hypothetical protein
MTVIRESFGGDIKYTLYRDLHHLNQLIIYNVDSTYKIEKLHKLRRHFERLRVSETHI